MTGRRMYWDGKESYARMHYYSFAEVVFYVVGYAVVHVLTMYGLWNEECI